MKQKIKLPQAIAKALEHTLSIPYYKEDTVDRMMAIQLSDKTYWVDNSHMLNELTADQLYLALTEGYEVEA